ncbi:MAG: proton-conducting transporter membrane subunit, partial [Oscillospiraceae bacterium]
FFMIANPQQITYRMGHFPAPWGNEIRFGPLEALIASVFCFVMLVSLISGKRDIFDDVSPSKLNLFYIMINLLLSSLLALVYTNDLFTAYVFVEINTLSACAVVMAKENGKTVSATIRYLIMSLLGSGMFLLSIILIYDLTGHLLMVNIQQSMTVLMATGKYRLPITIIMGLMAVGMAIKSALFPFHSWLSQAHGSATTASSSILSGLVLKGYIILLIKVFYRVFGLEIVSQLKVTNVLFVFAIMGMIIGSLDAIQETHIKRMIAYSSVSQMGYIYAGIGLGTPAGFAAAVFSIIVHAITKPMLFSAAGGLSDASHHQHHLDQLEGAAYRNPIAGIAFVIGGMSMIGIPFFAGFATKYFLAGAALQSPNKMWPVLFALAISTVLNAIYYIRAIGIFYHKEGQDLTKFKNAKSYVVGMSIFIVANLALGLFYQNVVDVIVSGLSLL